MCEAVCFYGTICYTEKWSLVTHNQQIVLVITKRLPIRSYYKCTYNSRLIINFLCFLISCNMRDDKNMTQSIITVMKQPSVMKPLQSVPQNSRGKLVGLYCIRWPNQRDSTITPSARRQSRVESKSALSKNPSTHPSKYWREMTDRRRRMICDYMLLDWEKKYKKIMSCWGRFLGWGINRLSPEERATVIIVVHKTFIVNIYFDIGIYILKSVVGNRKLRMRVFSCIVLWAC